MVKISKYSDMIGEPEQLSQPAIIQCMHDLVEPKNHFEDDRQKYGSTDPRSDKSVDHKYWLDLLWNAWHLDNSLNSLYYLFHGIRCGGGELTLTKDSFRLLPGDWSEKEWEEIKRVNLNPVKDRLVNILRLTRIGKVMEEPLPPGVFDVENAPVEKELVEQERMFG